MSDSVTTAELPPEGGKARKRKPDPVSAGVSLSEVEKPTELERFTRRRAAGPVPALLEPHAPGGQGQAAGARAEGVSAGGSACAD